LKNYPSELVEQLNEYGVSVYLRAGKVYVKMPWPPEHAPEEVVPLLKECKARSHEDIFNYLLEQTKPDTTANVRPARNNCLAAGHCLIYSSESDCQLFQYSYGWCGERFKLLH